MMNFIERETCRWFAADANVASILRCPLGNLIPLDKFCPFCLTISKNKYGNMERESFCYNNTARKRISTVHEDESRCIRTACLQQHFIMLPPTKSLSLHLFSFSVQTVPGDEISLYILLWVLYVKYTNCKRNGEVVWFSSSHLIFKLRTCNLQNDFNYFEM